MTTLSRPSPRVPQAVALPSATNAAILLAIIVTALYFGRSVFVPLALAVLLSFVLSPLLVALRKIRVPRALAVGIIVTAFVMTIAALTVVMARQVTDLGVELPRYEATLRQKLKSLRTGAAQTSIIDRATSTLSELGKELEQRQVGPPVSQSAAAEGEPKRPIPVEVHQPPERPLETYQRIISALIAPLATSGIVLILIVFILLQREDIRDRVIRLVSGGDLELTTAALNDAAYRLSRLFLAQLAMNAAFGAIIALGLWLIGVPSPGLWGVVAALMRFVPYVGAVLAAVFPILLAASVDPGWTMVIWTLALYLIVEPAVGHFIEPAVQGHTTGLSPLAIVVSAILWTALWGPIGLLLSTPMTICLVVLGRHVEGLAFLAVMLGNQPSLTAPQMLYQRLLSGSSAEALDQAEKELKKSTQLQYFDEVALEGLKLASHDAHRGAIDVERMQELHEGVTQLLEDLADEPLDGRKVKPEAEQPAVANGSKVPTDPLLAEACRADDVAVLCVGVRTPLDAAAAEILAQMLGRNGVPARVGSVARLADLSGLDLTGIRVIWLSAIDAAQSRPQIRYVARRLRRRSPQITLCGAFWDGTGGTSLATGGESVYVAGLVADAVQITRAMAGNPPLPDTDVEGVASTSPSTRETEEGQAAPSATLAASSA